MKRTVSILSAILALLLLASCSGNKAGNIEERSELEKLFYTECSADEALELAKSSAVVVFEEKGCSSGKDVWNEFYAATGKGEVAEVVVANYYTLDEDDNVSEEYYEQNKDDYPVLYFSYVKYDGKEYSIKTRSSTDKELESEEKYKYLLHFTGDADEDAEYTTYDMFVLADDAELTLKKIMAYLVSSNPEKQIRFDFVYIDHLGWKE